MSVTPLFALVDCNNFYASCERLFRPELRKQPVVVLSNNDGCVIARSNEVKSLNIGMGEPYYKNRETLKRYGVHVFSSNYALYGDLSQRVMMVLQQLEPEVEIYSIDEAFIRLAPAHHHLSGTDHYGYFLKNTVEQYVGIPVSIGIGSTKTRAKIAARTAKKNPEYRGVFNLETCADPDQILSRVKLNDIWGIGRKSSDKLRLWGLDNAYDLKKSDPVRIRKISGLSVARTVMELQGKPCITLENEPGARKSVRSSRTFARPVTSLNDLKEAVSCYVTLGAQKLRSQGLVTANIHVFIATSRFKKGRERFAANKVMALAHPTACTSILIKNALRGLNAIYKPGCAYKKAGILFSGLSRECLQQQNLFSAAHDDRKEKSLMQALDLINDKWGRDTLCYASSGLERNWSMRQARKSPAYTTCWAELPVVS